MPARKRHRQQRSAATEPAWTDLVHLISDPDGVDAATSHVFDPARTHPVLMVSCPSDTGRPRINVPALLDEIADRAEVYAVQDPDTTWALSQGLGPNLKVYGGAIRLIWPGATPDAVTLAHPLFLTPADDDGPATVADITAWLKNRTPAASPPVTPARPSHLTLLPKPGPDLVPATIPAATVRPLDPPVPEPAPTPAVAALPPHDPADASPEPDPVTPATPSAVAVANERLGDAEHTLDALREEHRQLRLTLGQTTSRLRRSELNLRSQALENDALLAELADLRASAATSGARAARDVDAEWESLIGAVRAERDDALDRAERAEASGTRLRKKVKSLTDQVSDLKSRLHGRSVFADPGEQFAHEVYLDWLDEIDEGDRRGKHALREHIYGPDFLDSVDALDGIARERIVAAVVDVLTGRVWTSNSREAHQVRTSAAGNAPTLVRDDAAVAWRCNLQTKTASARRLMWWEKPDGTVELGRVAIHDDMTLR